jgi:UDP-glucose 4-epimerase
VAAEVDVHVLVFGGAGFIGLNIAEGFLSAGHRVTLFDLAPPPETFNPRAGLVQGDVRDSAAIDAALSRDVDVVILGAAITAGPAREARDPDTILAINLGSLPPILQACRRHGVRRILNLSSAAAYGTGPAPDGVFRETMGPMPESLYAVTKFASERVGTRLAKHWELDFVNVRLSAAFGPWERDTGMRDTLSPQAQIVEAAMTGRPALLSRPGERDWIYAPDVAEAVLTIAEKPTECGPLYNVSTGQRWSALNWGQAFARHVPGFTCRLAEPGEPPNVDLFAGVDRPSLDAELLRREVGWSARFNLDTSARDLAQWWRTHRAALRA